MVGVIRSLNALKQFAEPLLENGICAPSTSAAAASAPLWHGASRRAVAAAAVMRR